MKIGIITMHKVLNYGSVLQAYALQHKISEMGYDSEIIDYDFPPHKVRKRTIKSLLNILLAFMRALIMGFPQKKKVKRFTEFKCRHLRLSSESYNSDSISLNPPLYDVYMTGSDQVWNPRHIGTDSNFLLSFVPKGKPKVSYASSFATATIPEEYKQLYSKYLQDYENISVREPSGVELVEELTGKNATVSCDPVFLLNRKEWDEIEKEATVKVPEKYILVYALYYMFDPYPELLHIIDHVQKELGCKVVYLDGRQEDAFRPNSKVMKSEGPADFIRLIKNAEIVITSSFHGVAFSLIYDKPLLAIVRENDSTDGRISSLLRKLNDEKSIIPYNRTCTFSKKELYKLNINSDMLDSYIDTSSRYLKKNLNKISKFR